MKTLAAISVLLVMAGCQTVPPAPDPVVTYKTKVVDTGCNWTKIITVSKQDVLTDETAAEILAHDKAYTTNCKK